MNSAARIRRSPKIECIGRKKRTETEHWESERTDLQFFRSQTIGIVRHFFEIASQIGRMPSILGREFFRARVSHHAIPSFEEQAVFVHDVERALSKLNETDAEVLALVGLFQFTLDDVATILGRSPSGVAKRYHKSIDHLAEIFLESRLLRESRPDRHLRRFSQTPMRPDLPPKKPAGSVPVDTYHIVGLDSGSFSFYSGRQEA